MFQCGEMCSVSFGCLLLESKDRFSNIGKVIELYHFNSLCDYGFVFFSHIFHVVLFLCFYWHPEIIIIILILIRQIVPSDYRISFLACDAHHCLSPVSICLSVGLSAGWPKNYRSDFRDTWMEDRSQPREDHINFWCPSESICPTAFTRKASVS